MLQNYSNIILGTSLISSGIVGYYYFNRRDRLIYHSNSREYDKIVEYIYKKYPEKINIFTYSDKIMHTYNEWRYRRRYNNGGSHNKMKTMTPLYGNFTIDYEGHSINVKIDVLKNICGDFVKLMTIRDCCSEESFIRTLELSSDNKEVLI